ncbi:hypothetical protein [Hippea sp. KM1]|nr:hypothetical protein [Hippea sp. KM1]
MAEAISSIRVDISSNKAKKPPAKLHLRPVFVFGFYQNGLGFSRDA